MRAAALLLCACCALPGAWAQSSAPLDDPRPEGLLSMRERSLCEPPDGHPNWCEWPHEVREFVDERGDCDHFRSEPWPEGDDADSRERRQELEFGIRTTCTGTDERLADLLRRYAGHADIMATLSEYERDIEATMR